MMWSASATTAVLWPASSPEWPCVAIGTRDAAASTATMRVDVQPRTAKVSTVSAAPAIVTSDQARPSSVSTRNRPSWPPNSAPALGVVGMTLTKVRNAVVPLATVKIAAPTDAASSAVSKGRSPARSANSARTSEPSIVAADRLTASVATGRPQRTRGPGSSSSRGAAPPP